MDTQGEKLISSERYPQKARGMLMMAIASTCFSLGGLLIKMIPWNPLTQMELYSVDRSGLHGRCHDLFYHRK